MTIAAWALLALAGLGCLTGIVSIWAVGRRFAHAEPAAAPEPVTLLRPLHGAEPGLAERLSALLAQDYGAPVQLVCGVAQADDSAAEVVRALQAAHPAADIALIVDPARHGSNAKVSNLINMLAAARHDLLVLSDSDIAVGPDWVRRVTAALAQPGVGAVTALYVGMPAAPDIWARLAAMGVSYQFLPGVCLGIETGLAHPCMGSTIALRRATLDAIGGLPRVADVLADDYKIGRAVRALGLTVAVPPFAVRHMHFEASLAALWRQELRWARTVRGLDPAGYAGQLLTYPVPLALVAVVLGSGTLAAFAVLLGALLVRIALKYRIDAATGTSSGPVWLLPMRDMISLAVWAGCYFVRSVDWRGARHRLHADGTMIR